MNRKLMILVSELFVLALLIAFTVEVYWSMKCQDLHLSPLHHPIMATLFLVVGIVMFTAHEEMRVTLNRHALYVWAVMRDYGFPLRKKSS